MGICKKCERPEDELMVQCDKCDAWYHYKCVGVDDSVAEIAWECDSCQATPSASTADTIMNTDGATYSDNTSSAKPTSELSKMMATLLQKWEMENRSKETPTPIPQKTEAEASNLKDCRLRLARLEEEKKIQQEFLARKYEILAQADGITLPELNVSVNRPTATQLSSRHMITNDLPKFFGDPEDWPIFISNFENSTELAGYSLAENLIRLQACLKGKAREMVRSRLMLPEMVPEIISTRRMVFGRSELIIENLINKARKLPKLNDRLESLVDFALVVRNIYATMETCKLTDYMSNPMLVRELLDKMPNQHKYNWAMLPKDSSVPVIKVFSDWLYAQAQEISKITMPSSNPRHGEVNTHTRDDKPQDRSSCIYCESRDHNRVAVCPKFKELELCYKWTAVRNLKLCKQCLNVHQRRCFMTRSCGINGCTFKHHQLLHKPEAVDPETQRNANGTCNSHHTGCHENKPLFRILPIRLFGKDKFIDTFAFLDEGSSVTLIEEDTYKSLGLSGMSEPLCLRWTGGKTRKEIANTFTNEKFRIKDVHTIKNLRLPIQTVNMTELSSKYKYLTDLPIASYCKAQPKILIGSNNWSLAVPLKIREGYLVSTCCNAHEAGVDNSR